jgi:hypothetical protein
MYNRKASKIMIDVLLQHAKELDDYLVSVRDICSEEEFSSHKRIVGTILGSMLLDGINVLSKEFPDLRPKQLE